VPKHDLADRRGSEEHPHGTAPADGVELLRARVDHELHTGVGHDLEAVEAQRPFAHLDRAAARGAEQAPLVGGDPHRPE